MKRERGREGERGIKAKGIGQSIMQFATIDHPIVAVNPDHASIILYTEYC